MLLESKVDVESSLWNLTAEKEAQRVSWGKPPSLSQPQFPHPEPGSGSRVLSQGRCAWSEAPNTQPGSPHDSLNEQFLLTLSPSLIDLFIR